MKFGITLRKASLLQHLSTGLVCILVLGMGCMHCLAQAVQISLSSLLKELADTSSIARFPQRYYTSHEASSYDRARISPDLPGWFANSDQNQYIRTETTQGRTEKVMMDADGPGAIVRFWLTTDQNKHGTMRVYLDGASTPQISFLAYDLFTSGLNVKGPLAQAHPGYRPDGNGGNTLYLPIPYAKHCKVTWEEKSQGARYYQINYRSYDADTRVKTFTNQDLESARPSIERVNQALAAPVVAKAPGQTSAVNAALAPGGKQSLALPGGPNAVQLLTLKLNPKLLPLSERALRSLILEMRCDGEDTVWCPVSDLFGSGVGLNTVRNRFTQVDKNGEMRCCWAMPYRISAQIALHNLGDAPISAALSAHTAAWIWDENSMHFHASWHYEMGLKTDPVREWNYNTIAGRGVYVGDVLALYNPLATWYGEGNEKIWVDSDTFPSHLGTGTEDYYGFSYAPQPVFLAAFVGQPRLDQEMTQGHSTLIRTRGLDAIPFRRALKFNFELISWKPMALTYAATTFWYALPGATSTVAPQPTDATRPVPTLEDARAATAVPHKPGAIECETMHVVSKTENLSVGVQDMEPFGGARWSAGKHLIVKAKHVGDELVLQWPSPDNVPHRIHLYPTQAPDFATLQLELNDHRVAETLDCWAPAVQPGPAFDLGVATPEKGLYTLRITVCGANANSVGAKYFFGLDYVTVEKP